MKIRNYFKTLGFILNLYQEPGATKALTAFLLNQDTEHLTIDEMEMAIQSQLMETLKIFSCGFLPGVGWRDFYNLYPEKMLFALGPSFSGINFPNQFRFSNKVFLQSLLASMLSYALIGELSPIVNKNSPPHIDIIAPSDAPEFKLSDVIYGMLLFPAIFLYVAIVLLLPALMITYINLRLLLAIDTIGSTTPLHRAVISDDKPKFESLLFSGANMYKLNNKNKRLDELQPNNAKIKLEDYGYKPRIPA